MHRKVGTGFDVGALYAGPLHFQRQRCRQVKAALCIDTVA